MCFAPPRLALFQHLDFQKWSGTVSFLHYWLGHVLRATTACTCSTPQLPKVVPRMVCFVHFDLEMCFVPQRRALFRHLNFQKWSETVGFLRFCLGNVLGATTACASLIWPDGSAPAALARLLFDPLEPQTIGKHSESHLFAQLHLSFFSLFLLSDLLTSFLLLSDSSHLCFSNCPYCQKFHF